MSITWQQYEPNNKFIHRLSANCRHNGNFNPEIALFDSLTMLHPFSIFSECPIFRGFGFQIQTDRQMNEQTNKWKNEWMNRWTLVIVELHLQLKTPKNFNVSWQDEFGRGFG